VFRLDADAGVVARRPHSIGPLGSGGEEFNKRKVSSRT
jgi:hypothetical protein